jgi:SAM-dependent methyltransferase
MKLLAAKHISLKVWLREMDRETKINLQKFSDELQDFAGKVKAKLCNDSLAKPIKPNQHYCPVCESPVQMFGRLPDEYYKKLDEHGFIFSIFQFETLNQLQYLCPHCGASDRDRLYAMYLDIEFSGKVRGKNFLDIAPSNSLRNFINRKYPGLNYRSADLEKHDVDDSIDITNMSLYKSGSFDFLICSHVLEHIENDLKAIKELYRVLSSTGRGIIMAPIMLSLEQDYENSSIEDSGDRWKHFGQDDHVRMYSKQGFLGKLASVGFNIQSFDINFFGSNSFSRYGIHPRSVLYLVNKESLGHSSR